MNTCPNIQNRETADARIESEAMYHSAYSIKTTGSGGRGCAMQGRAGDHGNAKVLVAIANHGTKNQHFLERLLEEYRSMQRHLSLIHI